MHIAICIATCDRPKLLRKLLAGIAGLTFTKCAIPEITVIVVDNDVSGTAREVCRSVVLPWQLEYVLEPKRGIAAARNRSLREIGDADFVAFIDDDEVPRSTWLDELLWTQASFRADAVAGPVHPCFTEDVPGWIKNADFFDKPVHSNGESLAWCASGNVLLARNVLEHVTAFDDRFDFAGYDFQLAGRDGVFVIDPQRASPLLRMVEPLGVRRPEFGRRMRESMTVRAPRIVVATAIAGAAA